MKRFMDQCPLEKVPGSESSTPLIKNVKRQFDSEAIAVPLASMSIVLVSVSV
ncbi:hypothetical protein ACLESD_14840 [Pyxidicoccus sp. 3LFB2]